MCTAFLMLDHRVGFRVTVLLNRDEFYGRPTLEAHRWPGPVPFVAGEDEKYGGTWAGVSESGRFAFITNFRDFGGHRDHARSRGGIVSAFLGGTESALEYVEQLRPVRSEYNDFNLVVGFDGKAIYYSSRQDEVRDLGPGLYGLSNDALDTAWPKVVRGKRLIERLLQRGNVSEEALLDVMLDQEKPADDLLPQDSPVGLELERELSSIFVSTAMYGTCSTTLICIDDAGHPTLVERTFRPEEEGFSVSRLSFGDE